MSNASSDDPTIAIETTADIATKTADGDRDRLAQKAFARVGESSCSNDADRTRPTRTIKYGSALTKLSGITRPYVDGEGTERPNARPVTTLAITPAINAT